MGLPLIILEKVKEMKKEMNQLFVCNECINGYVLMYGWMADVLPSMPKGGFSGCPIPELGSQTNVILAVLSIAGAPVRELAHPIWD